MRPSASWAWISRAEAVEFARAHYRAAQSRVRAGILHRPAASPMARFDLVVAFEVIEHLEDWRDSCWKCGACWRPAGQFIVSTPNKLYYTESRGAQGANPFHVHEFDFEEFRAELKAVFPHVSLFLENHVEGVTFQPHEAGQHGGGAGGCRRAGARRDRTSSWRSARTGRRSATRLFVYVPRAANVLRERERHIAAARRRTGHQGRVAGQSAADRFDASIRSCWPCSASRRKSWSAATGGRRS